MPPLVCPSPIILDQSFPRTPGVLRLVGAALGGLQEAIQRGQACVALTDVLQLFVEEFDWQRTGPYPLLVDIHNLLVQWFLQPHHGLMTVNLEAVQDCGHHPIPSDCEEAGLVFLWAEELNKFLTVHDSCSADGSYFIGVACHRAFAGEAIGRYTEIPNHCRRFPLVGPVDLQTLTDALEWQTPQDLHLRQVTFAGAMANVGILGADPVENPRRGSHFKVKFPGGRRSWVLDPNVDPLDDDFIRELVPITYLPFEVIKTVLLEGKYPDRVLKLTKTKLVPPHCIKFGA